MVPKVKHQTWLQMCRAQGKMKTQDLLLKSGEGQGGEAFFFPVIFLSTPHSVFDLLFNSEPPWTPGYSGREP